ncbi:hypothetical protein PoHVEF18_004130 [Penicillium ochrochloron]
MDNLEVPDHESYTDLRFKISTLQVISLILTIEALQQRVPPDYEFRRMTVLDLTSLTEYKARFGEGGSEVRLRSSRYPIRSWPDLVRDAIVVAEGLLLDHCL